MEILQLRYFKVVAELENMSQAAKELNIVQSAVSRSIKRLEEELGTPLFDRLGRRIVLNNQGKLAYERAVGILDEIDRLKEDVSAEANKVTIGLSVEACSALMPLILAKYKSLCPEVEIVMDQQKRRGHYDVRITSVPLGERVTNGQVVLTESVKLLVPHDKVRMDDHGNVAASELFSHPFIGLKSGAGLRELTDGFAQGLGHRINYVFETDNPNMLRSMIQSGIGLVFFPEITWGSYDKTAMTMVGIAGHDLRRQIVLQQDNDHRETARFCRFLEEELRLP